jgi:hypothetical protein
LNETDRTVFIVLVSVESQLPRARLLIDSIRSFGGDLRDAPIWLFEGAPGCASCSEFQGEGVQVHRLSVQQSALDYWFGDKVHACARAEEMAASGVRSLVWVSPDCLFVRPPLLFDLGSFYDAAVRPVHIKNVGVRSDGPLDGYWKRIYGSLGVDDVEITVESFVDRQRVRAYYNTHALSVNPSKGLFRRLAESFDSLVQDDEFQFRVCSDEWHRIFLHQAILSSLVASVLEPERIRNLPPDYIYPYNLHDRVPVDRRARILNDLVCIAYEDRSLNPSVVDNIRIDEPLSSWLSNRVKEAGT